MEKNKKLYLTQCPNPIHLYINQSIDYYNRSEKHKSYLLSENESDDTPVIIDGDFYKAIQYRISAIVFLKSSIEVIINDSMCHEFKYEGLSKDEVINQVSLIDKLTKILPQSTSFKMEENKDLINDLIEICKIGSSLQNISTSKQSFGNTYEAMLKLDLERGIEQTKSLFYTLTGQFIREI